VKRLRHTRTGDPKAGRRREDAQPGPRRGRGRAGGPLAEWIAGYKVPKSVEFRAEPLPLSGAMKVLKRQLRAPYWEGHERGVN